MHRRTLPLCIAILLASLSTSCIDPKDRRPGLRLSGEVESEIVTDWSFAKDVQEVFLETKTAYLVPHSVTTVCAGVGETLYVPSVYFEGGAWPDKFWNANVVADPRVRMKIGEKIYPLQAEPVTDPGELEVALDALAAKYPFWSEQLSKPASERFDMAMIRMDPRRD